MTTPVATTALTFDDEFANFSSSPTGTGTTWSTTYPYGGEAARSLYPNNEAEYYSDPSVGENPFSLNNGVLSISATPAAPGSNPYNLPYDSGLITTSQSFSQTYGYFEVRAELPAQTGLWPAFWLLPASINYTSELDVFEQVGAAATTIYSTVHGSTNGVWGSDFQTIGVPNTATGFHTYGVDWEKTNTTFYVDGRATVVEATPASMNDPMFMILNLAVGGAGSWPGLPDASTTFPAAMQIDYVRAYATAGTTQVGGGASIPLDAAQPVLPTVGVAILPAIAVGQGPDTLALQMSEDAWQGDAQFTVSVDGVQIGGVQTVTASHALQQTLEFDIQGLFGAGAHTVAVDFVNDAWGGSGTTDRNLYVDSATIDGVAVSGASLAEYCGGAQALAFTQAGTAIGPLNATAGPDTLALRVSEDAWQGDAQFTVSVDGQQIGGVQTVTARHGLGQSQEFDIAGTFGAGSHTVTVDFVNDATGGTAATDRNLYVTSAAIDGKTIGGASLVEQSGGPQSFGFTQAATTLGASAGSLAGPDTLALRIAEDAWQGDAQFVVLVDGQQVGGVMTATASHGAGQSQEFDVRGSFGAGQHTVSVDFLNDAYGGTAITDRNLFVTGATLNGAVVAGGTLAEYSAGAQSFGFVQTAATPSALSATPGGDTILLNLSEDAWQGDAQCNITIDGTTIGGPLAVTAAHGAGQTQAVALSGNWGAGPHTVGVQFINDAWGGSGSTDRNLYVDGVSYDGQVSATPPAALLSNGWATFATGPAPLMLHLSEDSWQGDAAFSVTLDGQSLGAAQTVTAQHGAGLFQNFAFDPSVLAAGTHDLAVSFLNDAYAGTPWTDRNLYVDGIDVNGVAVGGASAAMYSAQTNHFSIVIPQ